MKIYTINKIMGSFKYTIDTRSDINGTGGKKVGKILHNF